MSLFSHRCGVRCRVAAATLALIAVVAPAAAQSPTAAARPTVWVLSTGGTIAGTGASPTDLSNYKAGTLSGQALVDAVPQIRQIADIKVEQVANVVSSDITLDLWLKLAQRINRILADDPAVAGVVVTHGTNTLEETAYFLNLTVKSDRPVVLVGVDAAGHRDQRRRSTQPAQRRPHRDCP